MKLKLKHYALLMMVLCAVAIVATANADEGHGHDHHDDGGDVTVPVDIKTGSVSVKSPVNVNHESKALALSNSLGDVDIAACMGSVQWSSPLFGKQKLVLNYVCMAEFYLKNAKYELAAMALCNVPEIIKEFENEKVCENAHDFGPIDEPEPEVFHHQQELQDGEIEQVQMAQNDIYSRIEALEQKPAPRVVQAAAPAPKSQPRYTKEQRAAVFKSLGVEEDEE